MRVRRRETESSGRSKFWISNSHGPPFPPAWLSEQLITIQIAILLFFFFQRTWTILSHFPIKSSLYIAYYYYYVLYIYSLQKALFFGFFLLFYFFRPAAVLKHDFERDKLGPPPNHQNKKNLNQIWTIAILLLDLCHLSLLLSNKVSFSFFSF